MSPLFTHSLAAVAALVIAVSSIGAIVVVPPVNGQTAMSVSEFA